MFVCASTFAEVVDPMAKLVANWVASWVVSWVASWVTNWMRSVAFAAALAVPKIQTFVLEGAARAPQKRSNIQAGASKHAYLFELSLERPLHVAGHLSRMLAAMSAAVSTIARAAPLTRVPEKEAGVMSVCRDFMPGFRAGRLVSEMINASWLCARSCV